MQNQFRHLNQESQIQGYFSKHNLLIPPLMLGKPLQGHHFFFELLSFQCSYLFLHQKGLFLPQIDLLY